MTSLPCLIRCSSLRVQVTSPSYIDQHTSSAKPIVRMMSMIETTFVDRIDTFSYSFAEQPLLKTMTEENPRRRWPDLIILQMNLARDNFSFSLQDSANCKNDICFDMSQIRNKCRWYVKFCVAKRNMSVDQMTADQWESEALKVLQSEWMKNVNT
jgi:hypothetical protein